METLESRRLLCVPGTTEFPACASLSVLVEANDPARYLIPPDDSLGSSWTTGDGPIDGARWKAGRMTAGYSVGQTVEQVANRIPAGAIGNQEYTGALGMDFVVTSPIRITELGTFDDGSDGLNATITVQLWSRDDRGTPTNLADDTGTEILAARIFTPADAGRLVGGSRYKPLAQPLLLGPGAYTIVAFGYGPAERNGNAGLAGAFAPGDLPDTGGVLEFVGPSRHGPAAGPFPTSLDSGPANRYGAGTFLFAYDARTSVVADLLQQSSHSDLERDMFGRATSVYLRSAFQPDDLDPRDGLVLGVNYDDGFVAYLNGVEVARRNAPTPAEFDSAASVDRPESDAVIMEEIDVSQHVGLLTAGTNWLAIHALNDSASSGEFLVSARLAHFDALPIAVDDVYETDEDTPLVVGAAAGLLANDHDDDSDGMAALVAGYPTNGSLTVSPDGSFEYVPDPGFHGSDSFRYVVDDGPGVSAPATVAITVHPLPDAPVAVPDEYRVGQGETLRVESPEDVTPMPEARTFLARASTWRYRDDIQNGSDYPSDTAFRAWKDVGYDDSGWPSGPALLGYGTIDAAPLATTLGFGGNSGDKFRTYLFRSEFEVADEVLLQSLTLDLLADDGAAVYLNGIEILRHNLPGTLGDGALRTDTLTSSTGNEDSYGSFTVDVSQLSQLIVKGSNSVAVEVHQTTPASSDIGFDMAIDAVVVPVVQDEGLLANDRDDDGDALSALLLSGPDNGDLTMNADGTFEYSPDAGFSGRDSFTYGADDGTLTSDPAVATLIVIPVGNTPPTAQGDQYQMDEDSILVVDAAQGLLNNDTDAEDDQLASLLVEPPARGTVTLGADGSLTYTPQPDFSGTDVFTYRADDGFQLSATTTATVVVNAMADPPVAVDDAYVMSEGEVLSVDRPTSPTSVAAFDGGDPEEGLDLDGDFLYAVDVGGQDQRRIRDANFTSDMGTSGVIVDADHVIQDWEDRPQFGSTGGDENLESIMHSIRWSDLILELRVFNLVPGDAYKLQLLFMERTSERSFDVRFNSRTIVPDFNPGQVANEDFSGTGVVVAHEFVADAESIHVELDGARTSHPNPNPFLHALTLERLHAPTHGVLGNDLDVDGDPLSATLLSSPLHGLLLFDDDGTFEYSPDDGFFGTDSFTYRSNDPALASDPATVAIEVRETDNLPVARDDTYAVDEDQVLEVDGDGGVLVNDTDAEGVPLAASLVTEPTGGYVELYADGSFRYVPDPDFSGTDCFSYSAVDDVNFSSPAIVTIVVDPLPDAPVAVDDSYSILEGETLRAGKGNGSSGVIAPPDAVQWNVDDGGNGHFYLGVPIPSGITWTSARAAAEAMGGHLVTITSAEETAFLESNLSGFRGWTGGFQDTTSPGFSEPAGGWSWVTGEPWSYSNWNPGEPNDNGDEDHVEIVPNPAFVWNDVGSDRGVTQGYYVEFDDARKLENLSYVERGGVWKYLDDGTNQGTAWRESGFDDATWSEGPAQLGYGDGDENTVVGFGPDDNAVFATTYFRHRFVVESPGSVLDLQAWLLRDDGAAVYLNGIEIHRDGNLPSGAAFDNYTTTGGDENGEVTFSIDPELLVVGQNVLSVEVHQSGPGSSDVSFDFSLTARIEPEPPIPGVLANDRDGDGDLMTASLVTGPEHGMLTLDDDGSFEYVPDAGFLGTDTFTYRATDGATASDPATVTIEVREVNDVPIVEDDEFSMEEDEILLIDSASGVLANDSDPENVPLTATLISGPEHGTLVLNADGSFQYVPHADYHGDDAFTYSAADDENDSPPAAVTITISAVNDAPVAEDDAYVVNEGETLLVAVPEPPADAVQWSVAEGGNGHRYFPVQVPGGIRWNDAHAAAQAMGGYLVTVTSAAESAFLQASLPGFRAWSGGVQDVESRDYAEPNGGWRWITGEAWSYTNWSSGESNNSGGDEDFAELLAQPAFQWNDARDVNPNTQGYIVEFGEFVPLSILRPVRPEAEWSYLDDGSDQGTVWREAAFDDSGWNSGPAQLGYGDGDEQTVVGFGGDDDDVFATTYFRHRFVLDDPARIADATAWLLRDDGAAVYVNGVEVFRDTNLPGGATYATYTTSTGTENGETTFAVDPALLVPGDNVVAVEVHQANPGSSDVSFDFALTVTHQPEPAYSGLLANDTDVERDPLTATLTSDPSGGTVAFDSDGTFQYTPALGFTGIDSFTYRANDGRLESNEATVTIEVLDVNVLPATLPDSYQVDEDGVLNVDAADGVLSNDVDSDGDSLTAVVVNGPADGNVGLLSDGSFQYVPRPDFFGTDTFTYVTNDGIGDSAPTQVTIEVRPVNDAPTATGETYVIDTDTALTTDAADGVLGNDRDNDGDTMTAELVDDPVHGVMILSGDGSVAYIPERGFRGTDSFTYRAYDGVVYSEAIIVTIVVDDAPVAADDDYTVDEDVVLNVSAAEGLLANDSDTNDDPLVVGLVGDAPPGVLELDADGGFRYLPPPEFSGEVTFSYVARDGLRDSETGIVTIRVAPVNDAPSAADDGYVGETSRPLIISAAQGVLANDLDVEGSPLTARLDEPPSTGTLELAADGGFTYTAEPGFEGLTTFTYRADDGAELSDPAIVTLAIALSPEAVEDRYELNEDDPLVLSAAEGVLANDFGPSGVPLIAVLVQGPTRGSLSLAGDGSLTYTPDVDFFGIDRFSYRVSAVPVRSEPTTVTLTVHAVNDAPVAADDFYAIAAGESLVVDADSGLLANDHDVDGDPLTAARVLEPAGGTLTLADDGSFSYTPAAGFVGQDRFTYRTSDGTLDSAPATVIVTISDTQLNRRVLINEIMYHPASGDVRDEYLELYNSADVPVPLVGWRIAQGVEFAFPDVAIAPGEYLVVAADPARFATLHPEVIGVIGGWSGRLSNSGETIELRDALDERVDEVRYADSGDWSRRRVGPSDRGVTGWVWEDLHDGGGRSLELINAAMSNEYAHNWRASGVFGGTPGAANSVAAADIAPAVLDVAHRPIVPASDDPVTISARLVDDGQDPLTASLFWRVSTLNPGPFVQVPMLDDGLHGDGDAGDGVFGAEIAGRPHGTIVEFYVRAEDAGGLARTYPGPTHDAGTQGANLLYQVDDTARPDDVPLYRSIMTAREWDQFRNMDRFSDAQMNATLISDVGGRVEARYNVGIRYRGSGSRNNNPPNNRIDIPSDRPWLGATSVNINGNNPHHQIAGGTLAAMAGIPAADTFAVHMIHNGNDLTGGGFYVHLEVLDGDWAADQFPRDGDGNGYRGRRANEAPPGGLDAGLQYYGEDPAPYAGYVKTTNSGDADWSDVIELTRVLNQAPDATFVEDVGQVLDIDQWLRAMAFIELTGYGEFSLLTGDQRGDDYALYRGIDDPRFLMVPYDLDSMFQSPTGGIFTAADGVDGLGRLVFHPEILPRYYAQYVDLIDNVLTEERIRPALENMLSDVISGGAIDGMLDYIAARADFVRSLIPRQLTATSDRPVVGGFPRTTTSDAGRLSGQADAARTRAVLVDGQAADRDPRSGAWSLTGLPLAPGINRILVRALDADGEEIDRRFVEVWRDTGAVTDVSDTIAVDTVWTPEDGPYLVSGEVTVAEDATLTVLPGTSVYFDAGARLTVEGRIVAEGTERHPVRFTRVPDSGENWDGLQLVDTMRDNRITHAVIEYGVTNDGMIGLENSRLVLDHVTLDHTDRRRIRTIDSSLIVRNSTFTDIFAPGVMPTTDNLSEHIWGRGIAAGGEMLIENNVFGHITGHNDGIDFDAPRQPDPIPRIMNNTFLGGGDDALDMTGDAHIEGNVFRDYIKDEFNEDPGESNVISASGGDYFVARNVFHNVNHVSLVKEEAFMTFVHNTVVGAQFSALYFDLPGQTSGPGRGATVADTVFTDTPVAFDVEEAPTEGLTVDRSLVPAGDVDRGAGNVTGDPLLRDPAAGDYRLRPGSPAIRAGAGGRDMGAMVTAGASVTGEPFRITSRTTATLAVGGAGITHYRYRVNEEEFGAEFSVDAPITLDGLIDGSYTVYVIGRDQAGVWQDEADATASRSWTVESTRSSVVINELLASNVAAVDHEGTFPDLIELYNEGPAEVDLSGMSLTDDPQRPRRFVLPAETVIDAGGYLVLYADDDDETSGLHVGFGLSAEGDGVYLYDAPGRGGRLLDEIEFGIQVPDLSIGRDADGDWELNEPTPNAANVAARVGDPSTLRINEWHAASNVTFADDFFELYNPDPDPVALGGLSVTDAPLGWPDRHRIAPLSFVAGLGTVALVADSDTAAGADHVDFRLDATVGMIGLYDADLGELDVVRYGPQITDASRGLLPDGGSEIADFTVPSRGLANVEASNEPRYEQLVRYLRITELMYNPVGGTELEFVELRNIGPIVLNLEGARLEEGIEFVFPAMTLDPGEHVVVVNDLAAFRAAYGDGVTVAGEFDGNLSNGGEQIRLRLPAPHSGDVLRFEYQDDWYPITDGEGSSLAVLDPLGAREDWDRKSGWRPDGPTPGTANRAPRVESVVVNGGVADPPDLPAQAQPSSWLVQRSSIRTLVLNFSEPVALTAGDLRLVNLGVNAPVDGDTTVPLRDEQVTADGNSVRIDFAAGELIDGVYRLEVLSSVTDPLGTRLDGDGDGNAGDPWVLVGDSDNGLYQFASDWNGDAGVSIFDFTVFAYWFGYSTTVAPEYLDLDPDAGISIFDFTIFAQMFGGQVVFPPGLDDSSLAAALLGAEDRTPSLPTRRSPESAPIVSRPPGPVSPSTATRSVRRDELESIRDEVTPPELEVLEEICRDVAMALRTSKSAHL